MSSPDTGSGNVNSGGVGNSGGGNNDKPNPIIKQNAFPMDLAPKIALVKPTDGKGATVQTHQFRTLSQQPMRVVMPTGTVQATGAQIIQTHLMPQAMLKQVDALGRTQITALPSRTMAQTSITVTRPLTPNTFMPRGVTTNMGGPRGNIRAQTPPISTVTNIPTGFVRGTIPPRTPSPAGTVIPPGATWMTGSQPVQLIRASIGHSPRTRIVSQNVPASVTAVSSSNSGITTISANIVSSQSGSGGGIQTVSQQQANTIQNVSSGVVAPGNQQTFVATLATVLPPRQQTATLVYSNPQQLGTTVTGQRLAVANPIASQRQVRPIQISNARLPNAGLGVRVSTGNISIRGPNIPVLAPSSVLTSLPAGASTTVTASNLSAVTNLPAARIIQVQQQNPGGTAQVLSTGRITGNLMTLHPLVMNASSVSSTNAVRGGNVANAKPSLTITHVGKMATPTVATNVSQSGVQLSTANLPQGATITASIPSSTSVSQHQSQAQQHAQNSGTAPIGIVMGTNSNQGVSQHPPHQIAQIVNLNQSGINVGQSHHIQIIGSQGTQQGSSTVVPLTITSRPTHTSLSGTSVTSLPASVATNISQIVRGNMNIVTTANNNSNTTTVLPIAKVLPQQQQQQQIISNEPPPIVSVGSAQNVYIHSRSPSNPMSTSNMNIANSQGTSIISTPSSCTYYMPVSTSNSSIGQSGANITVNSTTAVLQSITTNSSSITTNVSSNSTTLTASYAPQAGSFAVVPASNRNIAVNSGTGLVSSSVVQQSNNQPIPVRFNPQLIVDGNNHIIPMQATPNQQSMQTQQQQKSGGHMLIASNVKIAAATTSSRAPAIVSTSSRKRDQHSESFISTTTAPMPTKSAVKNLNPTLMSLGAEVAHATAAQQLQANHPRPSSPISRPGSSDGSTTVSATSSPGPDQQEQEELNAISAAFHRNNRNIADGAQFKNAGNLFVAAVSSASKINAPQIAAQSISGSSSYGVSAAQPSHIIGFQSHQLPAGQLQIHQQQQQQQQLQQAQQPTHAHAAASNGNDDLTPRKRARKQQLSDYASNAQNTKKFQSNIGSLQSEQAGVGVSIADFADLNAYASSASASTTGSITAPTGNSTTNRISIKHNESVPQKHVDFYVKRPKTYTLLDSYKNSWKSTHNHFQRYSDVKPREERRSTVVDLANQAHVLQKVNGWKIYHLSSQMEDLTELESQVYDKLASMLQCMEAHNQSSDVDRVNDLIKGNMQRSKIVSDSINEARVQILKVFDHKSHVSDIIHRCASKRNFKKREKS